MELADFSMFQCFTVSIGQDPCVSGPLAETALKHWDEDFVSARVPSPSAETQADRLKQPLTHCRCFSRRLPMPL